MSTRRLIRLISSQDHHLTRNQLVAILQKTGSDRYDSARKTVAHDYYKNYQFDFFAEQSHVETLEDDIKKAIKLFPSRTKGDRRDETHPDIAFIYDRDKYEEFDGVYDYTSGNDCYQCKTSGLDALVEVCKL